MEISALRNLIEYSNDASVFDGSNADMPITSHIRGLILFYNKPN